MKPNIMGFLPNLQRKIKQAAAVSQYKQISRSGKVHSVHTQNTLGQEHLRLLCMTRKSTGTDSVFLCVWFFHSLWSIQLTAQQRPCDLDSTVWSAVIPNTCSILTYHLVFHNGTTTLPAQRSLPPLIYLLPHNEVESQTRVALFAGTQGLSSA